MGAFLKKAFLPALLPAALFVCICIHSASSTPGIQRMAVTGGPIDRETLKSFAAEFIFESYEGSTAEGPAIYFNRISAPRILKPGESAMVSVPIAFGPPGRREKGQVYIAVNNSRVERKDDDRVIISNDPELVINEGILLQDELKKNESVRVLHFHKGAGGGDLELFFVVDNPTGYDVDVLVSKGLAGPTPDGIYAGHTAAKRFLGRIMSYSGRIIRVPPKSSVSITRQDLKPGEVTTGIIRLRDLSGSGARFRMFAAKKGGRAEPSALSSSPKVDGRLSGSVERAYVEINRSFECGASPIDIRIGEEPALFAKQQGFDIHLGNYGLIHRIRLEISNPKKAAARARLFYVAAGGPTRGLFLIDNSFVETGLLDPSGRKSEKLMDISLPPGGTKTVMISMMPQAGSFYPTRLVLM